MLCKSHLCRTHFTLGFSRLCRSFSAPIAQPLPLKPFPALFASYPGFLVVFFPRFRTRIKVQRSAHALICLAFTTSDLPWSGRSFAAIDTHPSLFPVFIHCFQIYFSVQSQRCRFCVNHFFFTSSCHIVLQISHLCQYFWLRKSISL